MLSTNISTRATSKEWSTFCSGIGAIDGAVEGVLGIAASLGSARAFPQSKAPTSAAMGVIEIRMIYPVFNKSTQFNLKKISSELKEQAKTALFGTN
jgi:hypothetical protein